MKGGGGWGCGRNLEAEMWSLSERSSKIKRGKTDFTHKDSKTSKT